MSAVLQVRIRDSEALTTPAAERVLAAPGPGHDNPLELLREAIARLNAPIGEIPDQTQMADLLAEVREALERASVIGRAAAQSEEFVKQARFDSALQALDEGLAAYPGDPALIARRSDAEQRQRASQSAATAQMALEEAEWLLNQNRLDLAASFLREKAAGLPDQPALRSRLEEIEALLPQWVQDRQVQSALGRVGALEELQQWQVALTIVEEALQSHSASGELREEARRIRDRLADQERQTKLARRLELIRQKISTQSWKQAGALLESTEKEYAGAPELKSLRHEADAGLRRAECEAVVAEARQCLADGELEHAEQVLRRGLESLGREPALEALHQETESERKYRDELRSAQILFGRRQLAEAESVLSGLVATNRSEARALLEAVRHARAESEEENFCERGRAKALKMFREQQFAQAIDLLQNLCSLFPDNAILERDLAAAQSALRQGRQEEVVATAQEEESQPKIPDAVAPPRFAMLQQDKPASIKDGGRNSVSPATRVRRALMAGVASLLLITAGGAAWKFAANDAQVSKPTAQPAVTRPPVSTQIPAAMPSPAAVAERTTPKPTAPPPPKAATTVSTVRSERNTPVEAVPARALKPFVPPAAKKSAAVQNQAAPLPPETGPIVSADLIASLPAGLAVPIIAPAPPQPKQSATQVPNPAPKPVSVRQVFQEAQLIKRTLPVYPTLARESHLTGVVRLEVAIDDRGNVKNVKAVGGSQLLTGAAVEAVRTWKYKAALLNGQPVASTATMQIEFKDDARQ